MPDCAKKKVKNPMIYFLRKDSNIKFPTPTLVLLKLGLWPFITEILFYLLPCVRDFFENETKLKVLRVEELILSQPPSRSNFMT